MIKSLFALWVLFIVTGCSQTTPLLVGKNHPASPDAATAPMSPPSKTLSLSTDASPAAAPAESMPGMLMSATSVAASYVCPMHPEVVSDRPGQCPKCGMTLLKKGERP